MYLPYIRGRQFDLIAIRELAQNPTIFEDDSVLPIIEPVQVTGNPLASYRIFAKNNIPFILIANPQNGGVTERDVRNILINGILGEHEDYYIGYMINPRTTVATLTRFIESHEEYEISLIHYDMPIDAGDVARYVSSLTNIAHNIFYNDKLTTGYIHAVKSKGSKRITLKDGFHKAANNAAYAATPREHFHDLHLTYIADGYDGFGDFCTIGERFDVGGFAPLAVAIHLTHSEPRAIITRHFVSDDMADRTNVAGKFGEAVGKLDAFIDATPTFIPTGASNFFQDCSATGAFPGLPSIKKLSIMHHIELMRSFV